MNIPKYNTVVYLILLGIALLGMGQMMTFEEFVMMMLVLIFAEVSFGSGGEVDQ